MSELVIGNIRFVQNSTNNFHVVSALRVSDGHRLPGQMFYERALDEDELRQAAQEWMASHPGIENEPPKYLCYSCAKVLESEFDTDYQFDNALWVTFDGGYGMFVDPVEFQLHGTPHPYKAVICHECAHDLCEQVPWIAKLIDPADSHVHSSRWIEEHPDHYGPDYQEREPQ